MRGFTALLLAVCIGVAAVVWQSYGDALERKLATMAAQFGLTASPPTEKSSAWARCCGGGCECTAAAGGSGCSASYCARRCCAIFRLRPVAIDVARSCKPGAAGENSGQHRAEKIGQRQDLQNPPNLPTRARAVEDSALPPRPAAARPHRPMPPYSSPQAAAAIPPLPPAAAPYPAPAPNYAPAYPPRQADYLPRPPQAQPQYAAQPQADPELSAVPRPPMPLRE